MNCHYLITEIDNVDELIASLGSDEAAYLITRALKRLARDARIGGGQSEELGDGRLTVAFPNLGQAESMAESIDAILNAVPVPKGLRLQPATYVTDHPDTPPARLVRFTPRPSLANRPVHVRYAGRSVVLDSNNRQISIGRALDNAIIIDNPWVSRHHATLTWSNGEVSLSDRSANNTYVQPLDGKEEICLSKDSFQLAHSAHIAVGRPLKDKAAAPVRIEIQFG